MDDFAALRLQIEWGADEALEEAPVDRLRPEVATAGATPPAEIAPGVIPPAALTPPPIPLPQGQGVRTGRATPAERALQAAATAATLEELRAAIAGFDGCALRDTAGHLVFAEGDPAAGLLLIGDAPGAAEDRAGRPFAGPAGAYLDRMLGSIGLERGGLLLTPLIPWRPPGDRPPSPAELAICLPFLLRLIALTAPRRLVLFGSLAARALLVQTGSRRRIRGTWQEAVVPGLTGTLLALPTFGPAELMRSPADRRVAWADLRLLRRTLDADGL